MSGAATETAGFDALTALQEWGTAEVPPAVTGFGGALGGYTAALALRAMSEGLEAREHMPRSLIVQLLAPVKPGRLELRPQRGRSGRSLSAASATLWQDDALVAQALASFAASGAGPARSDVAMPAVPRPADCKPLFEKPVPDASAGLLVEHRPAGGGLPLSGHPDAEILVWMRLVEDRPLDPFSLAFLADSAPPGLYAALTEFVAIPSVEIALHFEPGALRGAPQHWVLGVLRNRIAADGWVVEDGELWSEEGQLLVHARQLRRVIGAADR